MTHVGEAITPASNCIPDRSWMVRECRGCGIEECMREADFILKGWGMSKPDEDGRWWWLCPNCQTEEGTAKKSLYEASINEIIEKMNEADKMIRDRLSLGESSDMQVSEKDAFKESRLLIQQAINKLLGR